MKKSLILLSLLIIGIFVLGCTPKVLSDKDALTGEAVSTKNLNAQQKKDYSNCVKHCPSACLTKVGGACATEKIGVSLTKQEVLSAAKPELTKKDLPKLLTDGKVGDYSYSQKILFPAGPYIDFLTNDYDKQGNFLYFKNGATFAQYQLEFATLWPVSYAYSKSVKNKLNLLGEEFQVITLTAEGSNGKGVNLILKSTKGDYFKLRDEDITDNSYSNNVDINFEPINGLDVIISGEDLVKNTGDTPIAVSPDEPVSQIKSISVVMRAEDNYFVPLHGKLSAEITKAAEEKEALFTNNWDIYFVNYNSTTEKGTIAVGNICEQ